MADMPLSHPPDNPVNPSSFGIAHDGHDGAEVETTPSGREKVQTGTDPFTSRLPDEFFDELRDKRGLGRKLTRLRGIGLANPDPIVEVALRKISAEFGTRAGQIEDDLASEYLSDVEAVTSRLNARQLPRLTRLLLTQRGVYVNLVAAAIQRVEGPTHGNGHSHTQPHSHTHTNPPPPEEAPRERGTRSKAKPQDD
jgi:hypothetical protein